MFATQVCQSRLGQPRATLLATCCSRYLRLKISPQSPRRHHSSEAPCAGRWVLAAAGSGDSINRWSATMALRRGPCPLLATPLASKPTTGHPPSPISNTAPVALGIRGGLGYARQETRTLIAAAVQSSRLRYLGGQGRDWTYSKLGVNQS